MKNVVIILAGGIGSRVGNSKPKQFIEILGKPILAYTIERFQNHPCVDIIEIVCVENYINNCKKIINDFNYDKVKFIVPGGKDFQHSVLNGVNNLRNILKDDDNVLVHFGASPFVSEEIITDSINVCNLCGNAISTTPFYLLSGKKTSSNYSSEYIDRETIVCMNSPHTFKFGLLKNIYDLAIEKNIIDKVEPHTTTLMYELGIPIYFSKGSQTNIKITTSEDLELFEGYVLLKNKKKNINLEKGSVKND